MDQAQLYKLFTEHPHISLDSRIIPENCLFFALKGETHDANFFASDALENGAAYAIVDNPNVVASDKHIFVDDVLSTLQQLATYHRNQFNIPVIAITGSNGKTTTKELVAAVLSNKYPCLFTQGNLNNHIGVPLTLLQLNATHRIAVIEIGANHVGEIKKLCELVLPTYGLITNIGRAHLEGFGSFENVITAKSELYAAIRQNTGKVFVNICDDLLIKHAGDISRVTYGIDPTADYRGEITSRHPFISLDCSENCTKYKVHSQLAGSYNANNILAAICIGRYFGVAVNDIIDVIESYIPRNNRSQIITTAKNQVILDAYNANPSSMDVALESFSASPGQPKMCILGDMFELGEFADAEHKAIIGKVLKAGFEKVLFVGTSFSLHKIADPVCTFIDDTIEAKHWLAQQQVKGFSILVKGSRKMRLETLLDEL
ncbi:MAG: UDP-N-acetylmuramoyl-tripeptide--D-alanyl-D-alanine ligase [Bacteroidales bacterium]|nr:UDP-N-acetylmuramoyl-tripeptide--D-alanyl-D-alanine ligase [Bacteroidales bacterium]